MENKLSISVGQYSNKGRKKINQDFHDLCIPKDYLITIKGIAVAIADGISSSKVSQEASKLSVVNFLNDYYSTSESWSVKKSATAVIDAINSWLYSKNRKDLYHLDKDKGFVSTFSAMVLKSTTAHIFHIGDARIYRIRDNKFEQLTIDHRVFISDNKSYLARALGIDSKLNIDYNKIPILEDDIFLFSTDGVYEFLEQDFINNCIKRYNNDLDTVAKIIIEKAYENGSNDNLTVQLIRVDKLPDKNIKEIQSYLYERPIPTILEDDVEFDGYKIIRKINISSRSHTYLAYDICSGTKVVIKTPSIEMQNSEEYLESFLIEEWVAKRVNNINILKSFNSNRKSNYLYIVSEFIDGVTLSQWMIDNPNPSIENVRDIVQQIGKGLLAFHRLEMIHKDLRPANIMIDKNGVVKIIDFGTVSIKGLSEINTFTKQYNLRGTMLYSAPEYFLGEEGSYKSDIFSLGIIVYEMLSKKFPYGTNIAKTQTKFEQNKLIYNSLYPKQHIWIDEAIKKAVNIEPTRRYSEISEFLFDLKNPNPNFLYKTKPPLLQRDPEKFWQWISFIEFLLILSLISKLS
jgi:protein phosphatase